LNKKFLPREHKKRKKLKNRWRKPKGYHSKSRRKERHAPKMPGFGYRTPKEERKEIVVVHNMEELKKATGIVQIARRVGLKKKMEMLKAAEKLKVKVSNINMERVQKKIDAKLKKEEVKKPAKKKKPEKKPTEKAPAKKPAGKKAEPKPAKKPAPKKKPAKKAEKKVK
jgi:large subunit ribosomal protein L32e